MVNWMSNSLGSPWARLTPQLPSTSHPFHPPMLCLLTKMATEFLWLTRVVILFRKLVSWDGVSHQIPCVQGDFDWLALLMKFPTSACFSGPWNLPSSQKLASWHLTNSVSGGDHLLLPSRSFCTELRSDPMLLSWWCSPVLHGPHWQWASLVFCTFG